MGNAALTAPPVFAHARRFSESSDMFSRPLEIELCKQSAGRAHEPILQVGRLPI